MLHPINLYLRFSFVLNYRIVCDGLICSGLSRKHYRKKISNITEFDTLLQCPLMIDADHFQSFFETYMILDESKCSRRGNQLINFKQSRKVVSLRLKLSLVKITLNSIIKQHVTGFTKTNSHQSF